MNSINLIDSSIDSASSPPFDIWGTYPNSATAVSARLSSDGSDLTQAGDQEPRVSVDAIRREIPFTADLDDVSMVRAVHLAFHQGLPVEFIAGQLGVRLPEGDETPDKDTVRAGRVSEVAQQLASAWATESAAQ
jgi:hypothetical protein